MEGCGFFEWAHFDDDGNPSWASAKAAEQEDAAADAVTDAAR